MALPLPGLPSFDYIRAESVAQAHELLLQYGEDARLFLGGTDVFVQMRDGALRPKVLVDVKHLPGMSAIAFEPDTGLSLGAGVTMNEVARHQAVRQHYPLLVEAASSVASYQLRNRATVGGNLCNASPAADMAPAALVLEGALTTIGKRGERIIPAQDFFRGPGETTLKGDELLTRLFFPLPQPGARGRYLKLGRNAEGDLAIVGVAALGYPDKTAGSGFRFRIALASVAPTPLRVPQAEEILAAEPLTAGSIERAAAAAQQAAKPIDDTRASARYRKAMVGTFTRRAVESVWRALKEEG